MLSSLEKYLVQGLPSKCFYVENFISEEEEEELLKYIYTAPLPKWVALRDRRLQNWGGLPHPKGIISENIPEWLQKYIDRVSDLNLFGGNTANHVLINEYLPGQGISPHHDGSLYYPLVATINLNSYGILDFYEPFNDSHDENHCSTSFDNRYIGSVCLERRSLNVVTDQLYTYYMHGIESREIDHLIKANNNGAINSQKEQISINNDSCNNINNVAIIHNYCKSENTERTRLKRVSVTIRYVPKVLKLNWKDLLQK